MNVELLTITQANLSWAVNENWRRIFEAIRYKVPMNGVCRLEGDWDFQGLYSIRGIVNLDDTSAQSKTEAGQ